jgi:predicted SprT family Zn-dependent metalloprotease
MVRVEKLFAALSLKFGISPNLFIDDTLKDAEGGYFHVPDGSKKFGQIVISSNPFLHWKMVVSHEFAHALDFARNGLRRNHHDRKFYDILLEVICEAYRSPKLYIWADEYKKLKQWAKKDGFYGSKKKRKINGKTKNTITDSHNKTRPI